MITGSVGKARMRRDATLRPSHKWRVLGLSSGEVPISARLNEETRAGRRAHAGQLVRALDIAARQTLGVFDRPYVDFDAKTFADSMRRAASTVYGVAGPAFVRGLIERRIGGDDVSNRVASFVDAALQGIEDVHGQAARAAERFGLVAVAGALAIEFGLLDWADKAPQEDALALFTAWLETRGGADAAEVRQIIAQVRKFLEMHGDSRFDDLNPPKKSLFTGAEQERRPVINRAGYRFGEGDARRWYVLPQVWRDEVLAGFDSREAARVLHKLGMLEKGEDHNYTRNVRLPETSTTQRFYVLTPKVFEGWGEP
jgi:putative DNA primase/helicase